jgi:hypothetical protein
VVPLISKHEGCHSWIASSITMPRKSLATCATSDVIYHMCNVLNYCMCRPATPHTAATCDCCTLPDDSVLVPPLTALRSSRSY